MHCGDQLLIMNLNHTIFGVLMYVFAFVSVLLMVMSFILGLGILFLFSLIPVLIALAMNELDDKKIDKIAISRL